MEIICQAMEQRFHCRRAVLRELVSYINNPEEALPDTLYIFGHSGTGKTAIFKHLMQLVKRRYKKRIHYAYVNCVQCYTSKLLVSSIIEELLESGCFQAAVSEMRCNTLKDFVDILRSLHKQFDTETPPTIVIGLDNAERLRNMDINVLPVLLRLQQLTALNICVVLISQLPFEKYYTKSGLPEVLTLHCAQYSKNEMMEILCMDLQIVQEIMRKNLQQQTNLNEEQLMQRLKLIDDIQTDFYNNYLNVFLSVFFKACRELPELKITARKCFLIYMEPVLDGRIEATDVSRLWRHIVTPLRQALTQVYLRLDQSESVGHQELYEPEQNELALASSANTVRDMVKALELPYYGKYLLIAGFLASYNSPKYDKRLFVKHHGKQRKRMQTVNANAKNLEKMTTSLGPKSFSIDRLLAIFYAIIEEKVGLTCNLLSQISTLVHLKLLSFVSGEQNIMEGTAKLQCTVGLEFVLCIGKVVGFNVRQYLCDFM